LRQHLRVRPHRRVRLYQQSLRLHRRRHALRRLQHVFGSSWRSLVVVVLTACQCTAGQWQCTTVACTLDGCRDSVTGAAIVQANSSDLCLIKRCVNVTDASGNVAPSLAVLPSPSTCILPPASNVRCYRVVFADFRTVDVAAYQAKIGSAIITSFDQIVVDDRLIVYVCIKFPRVTSAVARDESDACDPTAQSCDVVLTATPSAAAVLGASLALLALMALFL
jgi:hypothetical protein